jgi:phosphotransferase system enzyme I (PtsI)
MAEQRQHARYEAEQAHGGASGFSMHPSQILAVKQQILRADASKLQPWAAQVLAGEDPAALLQTS